MDSAGVTKLALARAMKAMAREIPFSKITVEDLCARCGLNRTSFYYHFKDKYDLANWIFDTEYRQRREKFLSSRENEPFDVRDIYLQVAEYLYENRVFYSNALRVQGQNSMIEHFRELFGARIQRQLKPAGGDEMVHAFQVAYFSDAVLCATVRWITDKDCVSPERFVDLLNTCVNLNLFVPELPGDEQRIPEQPGE